MFSPRCWTEMSWTQLLRWDQVDVWCKEMRVHTDSLLMSLCCVFQDRVVRRDLAPLCCCYARCRSVSNTVADDWLWSLSTLQLLLKCPASGTYHPPKCLITTFEGSGQNRVCMCVYRLINWYQNIWFLSMYQQCSNTAEIVALKWPAKEILSIFVIQL